ncbi:hypothetical protein [Actinomadura litoris]|uniref:hypothetical protein n=1 Tax=Actinomadura litoris TaxID=2678616 RepID=UPI001FA74641|nr:hypothetical protein [Actinomadura litoris]
MNDIRQKDTQILTDLARRFDRTRIRAHLVIDAAAIALHLANRDYLDPAGQELLAGDLYIFRNGNTHDLLRWSAGDILGPAHDLDAAHAKICASLLVDDQDESALCTTLQGRRALPGEASAVGMVIAHRAGPAIPAENPDRDSTTWRISDEFAPERANPFTTGTTPCCGFSRWRAAPPEVSPR